MVSRAIRTALLSQKLNFLANYIQTMLKCCLNFATQGSRSATREYLRQKKKTMAYLERYLTVFGGGVYVCVRVCLYV